MKRLAKQSPSHAVSIKQCRENSNNCRFSYVVVLITLIICLYLIKYNTVESLGDPSDQYVVRTISKLYTRLDVEDPEEKNVFEGFRTSFLPPDEVFLGGSECKSKREVFIANLTKWRKSQQKQVTPNRMKRMSGFTSTSKEKLPKYESGDDYQQNDKEVEIEFETLDSSGDPDYNDDEVLHRAMHPEPHMDRGPLDDVVEQVRGQPELEEEEMMASAHVYKHDQSYKDIHAFWKGFGDKETIRNTQAKIMRQYMDAGADPCHDFYQYACGNWATLNPIPADKAGYDTFEMLRENLDTVLKDLLEFKKYEDVVPVYPGAKLDLYDNILLNYKRLLKPPEEKRDPVDILDAYKLKTMETRKKKSSRIIERIRRYLTKKLKLVHHKSLKGMTYKKRHIKKNYKRSGSFNENNDIFRGKKLLMYREKHRRAVGVSATTPRNKFKRETPEIQEMLEKDAIDIDTDENHDDPAKGDATMKARFLYKSCMNYDILQKRGHQPLVDLLGLFGGWPILDPKWDGKDFDWLELVAKLRLYNNDILLSEWVGPDIKNSDEFVIQFDQTSLGLPTRDYFLQDSNKVYLKAYKDYLLKIALLLGGKPRHVRASTDKLINFEINLAKITSAPEDRRNVSELYRRMPLSQLEKLVPEVKWRRYLSVVMDRDVQPDETVVMFALRYVKHLVKLIEQTDPSVLANYLLWRFVRHRVNNLDDRFQSAKQQFYFVLFGREQSPPRWKNCISQVNSNMGMALGSMFVRNYFDETSKNDTLKMTREIQNSFRELLNKIDWIDEKTKKLAAHKVDAMMLRIGYPDFILNKAELDDRYKEVKIHPSKYFENILNILQHLTKTEQGRLGQPVNKTLWNTAPAVVNAYYSRNKNQIMFPAGILQPPFYHRHFPRSLNYGGIGVVIGHEITHGFDDKGRLFDCDGNLHRWWSDSAIETFHNRAQCLIDQYGRYVVPEVNVKLDGVSTQGENIADNGGVKQAFRAYLHWLQHNGSDGETLPGLNHTHTQLFFLNFAQVWCGAMRPEAMRNKLKTAVHSPGRFRVIGTLSNSHDFAREFRCPPGSPMNPKEKCSVW